MLSELFEEPSHILDVPFLLVHINDEVLLILVIALHVFDLLHVIDLHRESLHDVKSKNDSF